jgi:hypothetical protein
MEHVHTAYGQTNSSGGHDPTSYIYHWMLDVAMLNVGK